MDYESLIAFIWQKNFSKSKTKHYKAIAIEVQTWFCLGTENTNNNLYEVLSLDLLL